MTDSNKYMSPLKSIIKSYIIIVIFNFKELFRYRLNSIFWIVLPVLWYIPTYVYIFLFSPDGVSKGLKFYTGSNNVISFYVWGFLFNTFITTQFWNMGKILRGLQRVGTLETIWTTPINIIHFLMGQSIFSFFQSIYGVIINVIIFKLIFPAIFIKQTLYILLIIIPFYFIVFGFGLMFSAAMLYLKEADIFIDIASNATNWFTGSQVPIKAMPKAMMVIAFALPFTYIMDCIRYFTGDFLTILPFNIEIIIITVLSLFFPYMGIRVVKILEYQIRKKGILHFY